MKRVLHAVFIILAAAWLGIDCEGIGGQLRKDGVLSSPGIESGPAKQAVNSVESAGESPMTDETPSERGSLQGKIEVAVSRDFNIVLASNPTTGYGWELATPLDEAVVNLVSREYKAPETKMVGAGGQEIWTFRALSRGQTLISLKYVRPWEKGVTPEKIASYTVIVH